MISPKYFLFYRVCAIIVAIVAILWWVKVPEEEIDSSEETPELVTLKEIINETESGKRSP
jgi:hypothetical protein